MAAVKWDGFADTALPPAGQDLEEPSTAPPQADRWRGRLMASAVVAVTACVAVAGTLVAMTASSSRSQPIRVGTSQGAVAESSPTTAQAPQLSPHFNTPESAMSYLASAWNRNDLTQLDHVTNPPARAALGAMHDEAINLRLNHCSSRPQGDYICYFDHDYPEGTSTTLPGGVGHAVFLVGPADTPGWYMTVFEGCG